MSERTGTGDGEAARTAAWTRGQAAGLERTDDTVLPIIYPPDEKTDPDYHLWDTWLLRDRSGAIADVDGYRVVVALTAPSDLLPGKRHDVAALRYFYSADGRTWQRGGEVFAGGDPLGSRQWAGSALYDDGEVYLYYTAAGERDEPEITYGQRIALAAGGTVSTDGDGLAIEGPWTHSTLLEPDGEWYERPDQTRGMTYTFRDPWFFEDPETGRTCLLFEGNTPVPPGSGACDEDVQEEFNGSVGVAVSESGDPTDFDLRPPLLDAVCVNQELERPHVVVRDGAYYLFVSSHRHTFAPGLEGVDGLYGFVAESLRGDYEPLNGSGLVLTNPANAPFQSYSWLAYPHREEVLVTSFFNYFDYDRPTLDDVALLPEGEQRRRFGGTLAPTVRLALDGDRTRIVGTLDHGHLPTAEEDLPSDPWDGDRERNRNRDRDRTGSSGRYY